MKKTLTHTTILAAAFGISFFASSAQALTVVNVNFGVAKTEAELVGPAGGSGETWNQAGTSTSDTNLTNSASGATTIDWSFSGDGFGGTGNDWNNAANLEMLESAFFQQGNSNTLTLSGLDSSKTYDLYIASFDQNSWGVGEMTFSTTNTTTTVGDQVAANSGTSGSDDATAWALDINYVLFEGIVPNGSDEIAILGTETGPGTYGFWSGFQLVEVAAVPEPSAFALIAGMFGLTWVMLRRRA